MKQVLGTLALVGALVALPHHSARAQGADTTKKPAAAGTKKTAGKEAHPRLVAAMKKLEESKKELEAAPDEFGGHKAEAIKSIDNAIKELRLAMAVDKK